MDVGWDWHSLQLDNEISAFHEGSFQNEGEKRRVVAGCAPRVGMTASAIHAMKMIGAFRPRYLAMVGIAAGLRGSCNMGDIIVADPTWDYGSGKWATREGETVFEIAPRQISLHPSITVL
jgi:nucleoside phosphorylase